MAARARVPYLGSCSVCHAYTCHMQATYVFSFEAPYTHISCLIDASPTRPQFMPAWYTDLFDPTAPNNSLEAREVHRAPKSDPADD